MPLILKEMDINDRVTLGGGYSGKIDKLIIIEQLKDNGSQYLTIETKSGKYPLIKDSDYNDYRLDEKFRILKEMKSETKDLSRISSFSDALIEVERIKLEGKYVIGPTRAYSMDRVAQMRGPIKKAGKQIRPHKNKNLPFVVVLFSKAGFSFERDDICELMFGKRAITFYVSPNSHDEPKKGPIYYGKGAMMKGKNTSFSAVSSLIQKSNKAFCLITVHNPSAKNPLEFNVFNGPLDKQFYVDSAPKVVKEYRA